MAPLAQFGHGRGWLERRGEPTRPSPGDSATALPSSTRLSNGLKEFVRELPVGRGLILDAGPAWQSTIEFFTERGFKIYADDILRGCREAREEEGERLLVERFLARCLDQPDNSFDGILVWDLIDYLEEELLSTVVRRLYQVARPGGLVLGIFHSKIPSPMPEFRRYRIRNAETLEILPTGMTLPVRRALANRQLLDLFGQFRSSKTFIGRDNLREALFLR